VKRPLRIGLAGISALYWPRAMAEGIAARPDATLVSFATLGVSTPEIRRHLGMVPSEYARRYGLRRYVDLEDMLEAEQLDAIVVCTRHTEHARWVGCIAGHGKDLFIAKTFATTMADANRMCAAESRHGIHIAVGPTARFLPWFAAARRVLDAGRIGSPFSIHVSHHHGTIDVFEPGDFYRDPGEGGPELSLGWYVVDLVLHFMQTRITRVSAAYRNFTSPESPFMDCGKLSLELAGGALASCDMYFCNRFEFPAWEMEIVGEKGAILVRQSGVEPSAASVTVITASGHSHVRLPRATPHWELFWIGELRSGRAPSLTASYAREVTRICLAARDSARTGRAVDC
jgi:myo-inositol 2-dehydrogenase / D-chiro-inositol 1-dehydrogenase